LKKTHLPCAAKLDPPAENDGNRKCPNGFRDALSKSSTCPSLMFSGDEPSVFPRTATFWALADSATLTTFNNPASLPRGAMSSEVSSEWRKIVPQPV
jgi:hypothetical protein